MAQGLIPALLVLAFSGTAAGKGIGITSAPGGIALPGSPYRYVTLNPSVEVQMPTIVMRIERKGGHIDRWWRVKGRHYIASPSYDPRDGVGLSADGRTLVLQRFTRVYPPRVSRFAVLNTAVHLSHPLRPGEVRPRHAVRRVAVKGFYSLDAVSPSGATAFLTHHLPQRSSNEPLSGFELRELDLRSGHLVPGGVPIGGSSKETMQGLPVTQVVDAEGRWAYTLFDGDGKTPFLLALDTVAGVAHRVDLPQLGDGRMLFLTGLRLADRGSKLVVFRRSPVQGRPPGPPLLAIDTQTFAVSDIATATAAMGRRVLTALVSLLPTKEEPFLAFARTPRRPGNLLGRTKVVGRSADGRPIELRQVGDPQWSGELLVFGCIHGDECGASRVAPLTGGCPDPSADIFLVPNLDPDGAAIGSRLNGRGVDLNRNFPSEWRPIGDRGDAEYSGPKPLSEPETRLAARIVGAVEPEATVWFHQYRGERPFVRAWGGSVPGARHFADLARMPFRLLRWPAGTGPNWQNHAFPGSSSFVVELPRGRLSPAMRSRLSKALVRMGRWVRED